ncbi:hypothetical protein [Candidatus Aciduliprofundum boonei]|uniref:Uncharacterized protein n=1 Tax=Aciduliprofundum boonei (strain DSM 19572 / T469) TaxID=439481 RepID=D3T9U0_ACIB4|nr:hypothetical protein [Candidatus Aciduliprofundum boonei]ADD08869.1 hypothetical protein Aboo_1060 [Aciduliprofundum boonei T469]HII55622.1 hypothetical protein [Candidatus Aciduliprofundum boonei]
MKAKALIVGILIISSLLIFLIPTQNAKADTTIINQNTLEIDGDQDAYDTWADWSNYMDSNGNIHHDPVQITYINGEPLLLFNIYMYKKTATGWLHLSTQSMTITVKNVYNYVIGFTGFQKSTIIVQNCKYVVFGLQFTNPENGNQEIGWLYDTQINANGFTDIDFYNYVYDSSEGTPIQLDGGKGSDVSFMGDSLDISSNSLVEEPGIVIRDVGVVNFDDNSVCIIDSHTPDLWLENVDEFFFNHDMMLNNKYYSYGDGEWTYGGIGIVEGNVSFILRGNNNSYIYIRNSHIGIAFENNGKGEAFNNSPYVIFENVDEKYAYNYGAYSTSEQYPPFWQGIAAFTGFLVAVAWVREGILWFSDSEERKMLAKEMLWKVSVGTLILAIIVLGYPAMFELVNWVFGGG